MLYCGAVESQFIRDLSAPLQIRYCIILYCYFHRVDKAKLYQAAKARWESQPATEFGMTASSWEGRRLDISTSYKFIRPFYEVSIELHVNYVKYRVIVSVIFSQAFRKT